MRSPPAQGVESAVEATDRGEAPPEQPVAADSGASSAEIPPSLLEQVTETPPPSPSSSSAAAAAAAAEAQVGGDHGGESCDVYKGRWVYDEANAPLYKESACEFLTEQVTCMRNGRRDDDYQKWRWQPDGCDLPRNAAAGLLPPPPPFPSPAYPLALRMYTVHVYVYVRIYARQVRTIGVGGRALSFRELESAGVRVLRVGGWLLRRSCVVCGVVRCSIADTIASDEIMSSLLSLSLFFFFLGCSVCSTEFFVDVGGKLEGLRLLLLVPQFAYVGVHDNGNGR